MDGKSPPRLNVIMMVLCTPCKFCWGVSSCGVGQHSLIIHVKGMCIPVTARTMFLPICWLRGVMLLCFQWSNYAAHRGLAYVLERVCIGLLSTSIIHLLCRSFLDPVSNIECWQHGRVGRWVQCWHAQCHTDKSQCMPSVNSTSSPPSVRGCSSSQKLSCLSVYECCHSHIHLSACQLWGITVLLLPDCLMQTPSLMSHVMGNPLVCAVISSGTVTTDFSLPIDFKYSLRCMLDTGYVDLWMSYPPVALHHLAITFEAR